jgi:hypothetical protein
MDLNSWSGKTHTPGGWTGFKIALGAKRWRCEYCRLNFASFRPRNEIFTFSRWKKMNVGDAVAEGRARLAEIEAKNLVEREAQRMAGTRVDRNEDD